MDSLTNNACLIRDGYKHLVIAAIAKGTEHIVADIKVDTDFKTMLAVKIIAFNKAFGILLHNTPEIILTLFGKEIVLSHFSVATDYTKMFQLTFNIQEEVFGVKIER